MVSKCLINKLGLQFSVYGLEEYKQLPEGTPLVGMFFVGGILENQQDVENTCQYLCKINEFRKPGGRYLIVLVIDHFEPTSKKYDDKTEGISTPDTHDDPSIQLYLLAKSAVYRISNIVENFDHLVFDQNNSSFVTDWGIIGFSTGGITAEFASSFEPKLSTVIVMGCSLDLKKWFPYMTQVLGLETRAYLPYSYQRSLISGTRSMAFDLRSKKLLVLNKERDKFAPGSINQRSIEDLRRIHTGREGHDWRVLTLPGEEHVVTEDYLGKANQWIGKWLVSNDQDITSKI